MADAGAYLDDYMQLRQALLHPMAAMLMIRATRRIPPSLQGSADAPGGPGIRVDGMRVYWTPGARRRLKEIETYIAERGSPEIARSEAQ